MRSAKVNWFRTVFATAGGLNWLAEETLAGQSGAPAKRFPVVSTLGDLPANSTANAARPSKS
jgi:hypothetical protein